MSPVRSLLASMLVLHACALAAPVARAGAISTLERQAARCAPRAGGLDAGLRPTRDASCYVTPRELARWRGGAELVVVDARPAAEFRRARIPGAVNLPLRALPARPFLKARRVLLVDRGYLGEELEAGCRDLRRAGFASVGIVEGGLNAWAQTMGDLEGDRQARGALNRIPAADFAAATRYEHWLVVDVTAAGTSDLEILLPGAVRVPLRGDPAAFRQALGQAIEAHERRGRGPLFVAVVEGDGSHYAQVGRALASLGVVHGFFLEGGLDAYRAFREQERARLEQTALLGGSPCEAE